MEKLEICIIYRSSHGRETSFYSIFSGKDAMDVEDYEYENFWQIMGGFEVTINGYQTIFNSTDFYHIVKPINFLLNSLYLIEDKKCDWFNEDYSISKELILTTVCNDFLKLKLLDNNKLSISFYPNNNQEFNKRGKRYFENQLFVVEDWKKATKTALYEYFSILSKISYRVEKSDNTIKIINKYIEVYKNISL